MDQSEAVMLLLEDVDINELEHLLVRSHENWAEQVAEVLQPRLRGISIQYNLSTHDAEEVLQDALVRITRNLQGDLGSSFKTGTTMAWLHRILQTAAIDYTRKRKRHLKPEHSDMDQILGDDLSPEDLIHNNEQATKLHKAIAQLPDIHRQVIVMYMRGLKYEEIANKLEIPIGTVKSRMNAALEKLRLYFNCSKAIAENP